MPVIALDKSDLQLEVTAGLCKTDIALSVAPILGLNVAPLVCGSDSFQAGREIAPDVQDSLQMETFVQQRNAIRAAARVAASSVSRADESIDLIQAVVDEARKAQEAGRREAGKLDKFLMEVLQLRKAQEQAARNKREQEARAKREQETRGMESSLNPAADNPASHGAAPSEAVTPETAQKMLKLSVVEELRTALRSRDIRRIHLSIERAESLRIDPKEDESLASAICMRDEFRCQLTRWVVKCFHTSRV